MVIAIFGRVINYKYIYIFFRNLISDGASMVKLYPVLKQATSSSPNPTPGYLYQILIGTVDENIIKAPKILKVKIPKILKVKIPKILKVKIHVVRGGEVNLKCLLIEFTIPYQTFLILALKNCNWMLVLKNSWFFSLKSSLIVFFKTIQMWKYSILFLVNIAKGIIGVVRLRNITIYYTKILFNLMYKYQFIIN